MKRKEKDLEFLTNIDEDLDNDVDNTIDENQFNFSIDDDAEEELDFDLNELINKIDAKIEEINKEEQEKNNLETSDVDIREIPIETLENEMDQLEPVEIPAFTKDELVNQISDEMLDKMPVLTPELVNQPVLVEEKEELNVADSINLEDLIKNNNEVKIEPLEITDVDPNKTDDLQMVEDSQNKIDKMDINSLFMTVSSNVKEASDIFMKNVEMKKKIDSRFEELKLLQQDIEKMKQSNYDEINNYKESVLNELLSKKQEIEDRLNTLKELQAKFEQDKNDFEMYKRDTKAELTEMEKEQKVKAETRKTELENLEDKLRMEKDSLDEERRQLSLDRIQYEADKNELANNMLKFNEIVGTFTDGVGNLSEDQ